MRVPLTAEQAVIVGRIAGMFAKASYRAFPAIENEAHPDHYNLDRDTAKLMGSGHEPHHCPGAPLARLEMTIALEEIGTLVSSCEIDLANACQVRSPPGRLGVPVPARRPTARDRQSTEWSQLTRVTTCGR
jgi:hypothetical protein